MHATNDGEAMEALTVRQKRARTPSSPQSRSRSSERYPRNECGKDIEGPSSKKSSVRPRSKSKDKNTSGKISLSRPLIPKPKELNKKSTKSE